MNFDDRNATNTDGIEGCTDWYLSAAKGERWVTYREIDDILQEHEDRLTYLWNTDVSDLPMFKLELANHIRYMNEVKADRTGFRSKCNREFEAQQLERYQRSFNSVLSNPLTLEQKRRSSLMKMRSWLSLQLARAKQRPSSPRLPT
jgi:Neuraminidase (sialidase)